jgi:hypothetical protein
VIVLPARMTLVGTATESPPVQARKRQGARFPDKARCRGSSEGPCAIDQFDELFLRAMKRLPLPIGSLPQRPWIPI